MVDGKQEHISFGSCMSAPGNADELIATTCGVWSVQRWDDTGENDEYGEWLYRSQDGGKTWISIYPGKGEYRWSPNRGTYVEPVIDYLHDGGYDWVYGKAIHWSGSLVINPENSDQVLVSSGNGVFTWDDIWSDYPSATFHPDGIEEVVCLDFVSVPGEGCYSAIYDYDGFIHKTPDSRGEQYQPNMGSTVSVAYCPQNPKVLVRTADKQSKGYYTLNAGETWTEMDFGSGGGKSAIAQIDENTYRIFKTTDSSSVSYSDDFGKTWTSSQGISGTKTTYLLVEPEDPDIVYGYTVQYNEYWYNDKTKTEPTFDDAHYIFYISTDGGKTFTGTDLCKYDMCDPSGRIAYLGKDNIIVGAGWNGMYHITDCGRTIDKTDVYYCKTVSYGAPEHEGDCNTLYMWGMPEEGDAEGIWRSQDGGKTWVDLNTTMHFGGTGNGNFVVGDMNEFGTVYMSTVGMGIICGRLSSGNPAEETADYGDVNCDGKVDVFDVIAARRYLLNPEEHSLSQKALKNADVHSKGNGIDVNDISKLKDFIIRVIKKF